MGCSCDTPTGSESRLCSFCRTTDEKKSKDFEKHQKQIKRLKNIIKKLKTKKVK